MGRPSFMGLAALSSVLLSSTAFGAATLRTAADGGYGQLAMNPNDDGSSNQLTMPFTLDFYGTSLSDFFVNNNGNITFGSALSSFTPFALGNLNQAMIAPYWADVDTRCASCGSVYVGSFAPDQFSVTWDNVGYYNSRSDKLNSFQLTIFKVGNAGDFDIEFRYNKLQWTTGDASDGINGLGGVPAAAGWTNGNGIVKLQEGSFLSPGALNMTEESNVSDPGVWVYNIRNASAPGGIGTTPENPILPTGPAGENGYSFTFNVDLTTQRYFIDPPVATGYDYAVTGALFTSAQFTAALTDSDGYMLYDGATLLGTVMIGDIFTFATPLASFQLRGINPANLLTPGDPLAFVSGFTFSNTGQVTVTQIPFVENYDPQGAVPEPGTWTMLLAGFGLMGGVMRRRAKVRIAFS